VCDVLDTEVLGKGERDTDTVFLWLRYVMLGRRFHLEPNRLAEVQDENIDFLEVNIDPLNMSAISASGFSSRRASDSSSTSTSVSFHNLNLRFSTAQSLHKGGGPPVVWEAGGGGHAWRGHGGGTGGDTVEDMEWGIVVGLGRESACFGLERADGIGERASCMIECGLVLPQGGVLATQRWRVFMRQWLPLPQTGQ